MLESVSFKFSILLESVSFKFSILLESVSLTFESYSLIFEIFIESVSITLVRLFNSLPTIFNIFKKYIAININYFENMDFHCLTTE